MKLTKMHFFKIGIQGFLEGIKIYFVGEIGFY